MKKLIFSVLAVAAMASCSKSELVERPAEAVIAAKSQVLTVQQDTKAPFEGITSTVSLSARVIASSTNGIFDPSNAAKWHDDEMVFGNGSNTTPVGFTNPKAYPTDGSSVYLCGLYPNDTNWSFSVVGGTTTKAEYTIDGKTDVMVAASVATKKADVLAAPAVYPTLVFNHMLTKLVVRAKAASTDAITEFGGVTDITLTKANGNSPKSLAAVTFDATTATAVFSTDAASFDFYTIDATSAATDTAFSGQNVTLVEVDGTTVTEAPKIAYSLVAPITADGTEDYELLVKTAKNTAGFPVKVNLKGADKNAFTGSTQGKAFIITLDFTSTEIQALATVTAWDEIVLDDDITIQ